MHPPITLTTLITVETLLTLKYDYFHEYMNQSSYQYKIYSPYYTHNTHNSHNALKYGGLDKHINPLDHHRIKQMHPLKHSQQS